MGIIVCITMLFGLLYFVRNWQRSAEQNVKTGWFDHVIGSAPMLLLVIGLWNAAWHGLRHLGSFWGYAALITGIVMLLAGFILFVESKPQRPAALQAVYKILNRLRLPIFIALLMGFLLYAVTLVQLNLNYPIIH
jgi:uncharacterized membrane protein